MESLTSRVSFWRIVYTNLLEWHEVLDFASSSDEFYLTFSNVSFPSSHSSLHHNNLSLRNSLSHECLTTCSVSVSQRCVAVEQRSFLLLAWHSVGASSIGTLVRRQEVKSFIVVPIDFFWSLFVCASQENEESFEWISTFLFHRQSTSNKGVWQKKRKRSKLVWIQARHSLASYRRFTLCSWLI